MFWLYDRPLEPTLRWIDEKFGKNPRSRDANIATMKAGYNFGETAELFPATYRVPPAHLPPGHYRNVTGNELTALGFLAASKLSGLPLFYGSYPITPASDILQELARFKNFGVKTFQAEDEIAAIGSAIGAAFGGALGLTGTSGPGLALKSEALGLAVMVELPLVVAMVQRSGPSTGMPTKTDQADLLQSMFGRNGECQVAIVAPATPSECFDMAIEAFRIAVTHMTPTIFLSDGYLGTGAEPWRIPNVADLPRIVAKFASDPARFKPYARDPKRWRASGRFPARPASSTASAASRRRTSPATSPTTPRTTTRWSTSAPKRSRASKTTSRSWKSKLGRSPASCSSSVGAAPTARSTPPSSARRRRACRYRTRTSGTSARSRRTSATCSRGSRRC